MIIELSLDRCQEITDTHVMRVVILGSRHGSLKGPGSETCGCIQGREKGVWQEHQGKRERDEEQVSEGGRPQLCLPFQSSGSDGKVLE